MVCENFLCLFNQENECMSEEIELDICGSCKSCVYIYFPKSELEKKKKEQLEKYQRF